MYCWLSKGSSTTSVVILHKNSTYFVKSEHCISKQICFIKNNFFHVCGHATLSNLCHKEFFYQKFKQKLTNQVKLFPLFPLISDISGLPYVPPLPLPPLRFTKWLNLISTGLVFQVMQTCKKLGIKTVAVFSEADAHAVRIFIIVIWYSCFIISSIVLFCVVKNRCLK